ncbi:MAG TPA: hypothetical protein VLY85_02780 [Thermoplasmata archaeon]|nr:hypothetical protein [Thermoplasmata archaeon]
MPLPYPVAVAALGGLTAGGIALAFLTGHRDLAWVVFPIVAVLAAGFLYTYAQRPGPEPPGAREETAEDDEPFEDPVEEADRAAAEPIYHSSDPASEGVDGPGSVAPPVPSGIPPGAPGLDEPSPP